MKDHFQMFAAYNAWANGLLYDAASTLSDAELRMDKGAFFGSLLATLNHVLVADRIWLHRLTGEGPLPVALNQLLHEDVTALRTAREAEDRRILAFVDTLTPARLGAKLTYSRLGMAEPISQKLSAVLAHVFNHQTHHRGQCHAILTALGKPSLTLDLLYFLRAEGQQWT